MHAEMLGIEYAPYQLKRKHNYKFDSYEFMSMHYIAKTYVRASEKEKLYNFIYIDNPNNPTGQVIDIADIERIVSEAVKFDITVIVDEAYGDFMEKDNSAVRLFAKYPNLIVVRTLSKGYGLAGLRIGYIIAHKQMIRCMNKMINPYMVGELDREIGAAALSNDGFVESCKADFAEMKKQLREALGCSEDCPQGSAGRLHMAETLDTNSLLMLYHDDPDINLRAEFWKRGVLVIDGYDFKGLDSSAARVRLPVADKFPVLLEAVREINAL
jgi:histidinol-phosphate aminotransferase